VYVLPLAANARQILDEQAREIQTGGGTAQIMPFDTESQEQDAALVALFDRSADYASLMSRLETFKRELGKAEESEARRRLAALGREGAALVTIDYFPGEARLQIERAMTDAEAALNAHFSPDEPHAAHRKIVRRDRNEYQGRVWATREHLWADRVCSAWLIRRFIDTKAKFVWLKRIKECPKRALGFDFDGAEFSHVDGKVTFEVLLAAFGLEQDAKLNQLAKLVHSLDVGGIPIPEAPGFAAILTGARASLANDDDLIRAIFPILDHLYAAYRSPSKR
jgi:hypothetical protein